VVGLPLCRQSPQPHPSWPVLDLPSLEGQKAELT